MAKNNLQVNIGANISGLKSGMKEAKGVINDLDKSINSLQGAFAGIASIGAFAVPLKAARDWAAAVNDLEDKTNLAGESASTLLAIGQRVGLATEEMSGAIFRMSKAAQTSYDNLGKSSDVFSKWGIAIKDSNGEMLSAEQILSNVAVVHREMANGVQKNAMEMEIFGRSGGKLNDLLNLSTKQLSGFADEARKAGLVLSHGTTQAFEDVGFEINKSKNNLQGLIVSIGAQMLPEFKALTKAVGDVTDGFNTSSDSEKRLIAVGLEGLGTLGAMAIAINAVSGAYDFLAGAAVKAAAAIKAVTVAATASPLGLLAAGVTAAGYAAYDGYNKYNVKNSKGEALYRAEYDDLGVVDWVRTDAVDDRTTLEAFQPSGKNSYNPFISDSQVGYVEQRQAEIEATKKAEAEKTAVKKAELEKQLENETEYQRLRRELDSAMNATSFEEFMGFLESEQMARLAALEEEQEIRQQFLDWRMEAEASMFDFEVEAAESIKDQLATGIADSITEGQALSEVFKNIGKSIVNMFVQFMTKKALASAMSIMLGKKEAAANSAAAASEATALSAAAIQQSIAQLGPIDGQIAYAAALGAMGATATASIAAATAGAGLSMGGGDSIKLMASGGIVESPTLAMIGEGLHSEAVIPLNASSFASIAEGIAEQGANMQNTMIINGDINNAGDLDEIMNEFSDSVMASIRGA